MSQQHQRHNDDDSDNDFQMVNGRPVLKDGARFHVPLKMLDSVQRQIRQHFTSGLLHDGLGGPVGFRPGFVILDDTALHDAREQARARYIEETTSASNAQPTGFGSREPVGAREGDLSTINGEPGHLKSIDGKLTCVPDGQNEATTPSSARSVWIEQQKNAWRS
jgi:hypothetical protein